MMEELARQMEAAAQDEIRRIQAVEREACCKDVCWLCATDEPVKRGPSFIWWHTEKENEQLLHEPCVASSIRERAWQQAREGEAK